MKEVQYLQGQLSDLNAVLSNHVAGTKLQTLQDQHAKLLASNHAERQRADAMYANRAAKQRQTKETQAAAEQIQKQLEQKVQEMTIEQQQEYYNLQVDFVLGVVVPTQAAVDPHHAGVIDSCTALNTIQSALTTSRSVDLLVKLSLMQDTKQQMQTLQQQLQAQLEALGAQLSKAELTLAAEPPKQRAFMLQVSTALAVVMMLAHEAQLFNKVDVPRNMPTRNHRTCCNTPGCMQVLVCTAIIFLCQDLQLQYSGKKQRTGKLCDALPNQADCCIISCCSCLFLANNWDQ